MRKKGLIAVTMTACFLVLVAAGILLFASRDETRKTEPLVTTTVTTLVVVSTTTLSAQDSSVPSSTTTNPPEPPIVSTTAPKVNDRVTPISESAVRKFALKTIDTAWVEFSRTLSPAPLLEAKRAIEQRFPGVKVSMRGSGMMVRGLFKTMCFGPIDSRPTGPGMVAEVPCDSDVPDGL